MFVEDYNYLTHDDAGTISGSITDQADSDFSTLSGTLNDEVDNLSDSDHNHNDATTVDTKYINLYNPVTISGTFDSGDYVDWSDHNNYDDTIFSHTASGTQITTLVSGIYDITYNVDFENTIDIPVNFSLDIETNDSVLDYSRTYFYNIGITDVYFSARRKLLCQLNQNDYFKLRFTTTVSGCVLKDSTSLYCKLLREL